MIRRAMLLVLTAIVLVSLSGCMGGGPGIDTAAIKAAIGEVIDGFETDVEAYDVDGMLACLSEASFELTLKEAGATYTKTYETLAGELEDDEQNQLDWRDDYGYRLDLQLGAQLFTRVDATGAILSQGFQVVEWATGIRATVTDQGTITWEFANISGRWIVTRLRIEFNAVTGRAAGVRAAGAAALSGFGFGVGFPGLPK